MRRRDVLSLLGGAAVSWPLQARAQQAPTPVVGFLVSASAQGYARVMGPILEGLKDSGYIEGRNVSIEYRWADYQYDRLPALAADLVRQQVAVIFTTGSVVSAIAAKSATNTIPVVFANGSDPVRYGLVASLNRPGGNVTGVTYYNSGLGPKRIELLREIVPGAKVIGVLVNPKNPNGEPDGIEIQEAGRSLGVRIELVNANSERDWMMSLPNFASCAPMRSWCTSTPCLTRRTSRLLRSPSDTRSPPCMLRPHLLGPAA
jgi:putative ABC transport system substrate-binding protein